MNRFGIKQLLALVLTSILSSCTGSITSDVESRSSISGIITDIQTGVEISQGKISLCPCGTICLSDNQGKFNFTDLEADQNYKIKVLHPDYREDSVIVSLKEGENIYKSIKLVKLQPVMSISTNYLDYGTESVSATLSIGNTGKAPLNWNITESTEWISSISPLTGICQPNTISEINIKIDRNKLVDGGNSCQIQITSNAGNKTITVYANKPTTGGEN